MKLKLKPIQLTNTHKTVYGINKFVVDKNWNLHEFLLENSSSNYNIILSRLGEQHGIYDKILETSNVYKSKVINLL
jgi:hypothetical protein